MRVRASTLNYRDLMVLKGGGRGPIKLGVVPLSDGAGEVAAIGDGVTRVKVDDRIAGYFHPRWCGGPIKPEYLTDRLGANLDGMLSRYAIVTLSPCRDDRLSCPHGAIAGYRPCALGM
jgi:NADPH:quinone reductase-like Zn-dependent oxidoreductase